jgi:hypothetical protein
MMTPNSSVQLTIDFQDPTTSIDKQEKLTQTLWQQLRDMDGVKVDRVPDPNPPEGSRAMFSFLWGLLQAEVSPASIKNLFGFLGDRVGNKPIKIKAKFGDGREVDIEVSSREELLAAEETIKRLAENHG